MKYIDRLLQRWRIRKAAAFIKPGDSILDLGCADGTLFNVVGNHGPSVGVDPDLVAGQLPSIPNVRFFPGYFPSALPEPMRFDAITMLAVLEHVPPDQQVTLARACAEHLKPGGKLIITVPSPATDYVLAALRAMRLIHGMSLEQHYGYDIKQTPAVFQPHGFALLANRPFQLGFNNLFVFEKTDAPTPVCPPTVIKYPLAMMVLCGLMLLATLLHCGKGFYNLMIVPAGAGDMYARWVEQRYIFAGRDPNAVAFAVTENRTTPEMMLPNLPPPPGGYPPWAYFTGAFLLWPPWPAVRYYFAALNLASLVVLYCWGYRVGIRHGLLSARTLGLACLCLSSYTTTIALGQYGLICMALLALMYLFTEQRHRAAAGVAFSVAMIKPIIPALFVFPMIFRMEIVFLITGAIYCIIANVAIGLWTGSSPLEMLRLTMRASESYAADSYGPLSVLLMLGIGVGAAMRITAIIFTLLSLVLAWIWRNGNLLAQFAIAAVCGRLWTYHKFYDNLMILFLLVALGELAIRSSRRLHIGAFLTVLVSLLIPAKMLYTPVQIFTVVAWLGGLAVLLAATPTRDSDN